VIELRAEEVVGIVDPSEGGRLVSLVIAGAERMLSRASAHAESPPIYWGSYPMVPWAGRIERGRIPTDEGEVRIEPNLPPSAIHGLGFERPWSVTDRSAAGITMECELRGRGWPFGGRARQVLRLSRRALDLELAVEGYVRPGPVGLGWHPWFARPRAGDLALRLDAAEVLVVDRDLVPNGEVRGVSPSEDLRAGPLLGDRRLDHAYVRAKGPAVLRWPDLEMRIEFAREIETVVVHTPVEGVCVEPQTMWPNAPLLAARGVRGTGLRILRPGERLSATTRWKWR
jgi:aldose 1-epimerase